MITFIKNKINNYTPYIIYTNTIYRERDNKNRPGQDRIEGIIWILSNERNAIKEHFVQNSQIEISDQSEAFEQSLSSLVKNLPEIKN